MNSNKEQHNEEPVCYCETCLSLAVKELNGSKQDVCLDCGNTDFAEINIFEWEKLYVERYNETFLDKKQEE